MDKDKLRPVEVEQITYKDGKRLVRVIRGWFHGLTHDADGDSIAIVEKENGEIENFPNHKPNKIRFLDRESEDK
jgi:hypothetical protein